MKNIKKFNEFTAEYDMVSTNESKILRIKGMSKEMDDFSDMLDVIDSDQKYLEKFKIIVTKAVKEILSGGKLDAYILMLEKEFFSNSKFIKDVLKYKKSVFFESDVDENFQKYGKHFSTIIIKGIVGELEESAISMDKYINDDKVKSKLSDISVEKGKEKFKQMLSKSKIK